MSEEPKSSKNRQLRNGGGGRFLTRAPLIWAVIVFGVLMLWFSNSPAPKALPEWNIAQVLQAAAADEIASGQIKHDPVGGSKWSVITGTLKDEVDGLRDFRASGSLTDESLQTLQATGIFREVPASTMFSEVLKMLLPVLLILGVLYFLFLRQIKQAGRGAMNFGKSRAKMLTRDRDKITFREVAGCDEAKEEVKEVVEFLRDPKKFQRIGGRIPKGVLLVGSPGTGKTLLARAVAGEAEVPFFTISGSDFVEMFVGVGAARVRDMFEQGRKNAPCIVFIDEIDAVGRQRGAGFGGGNDEREQTLNSLLVEMDGFDGHEGVIIMAATNRPDVLDSALMRPGRFDRQIIIDLPDLVGREEILKVHARKITLSKLVDLMTVARNTPGFSGADLANLLNEGALLAARHGKKEVEQTDLDEARDKIAYGRERRRLMDDDDKKITAYHEAGHALVQAVVDDGHLPIHKVTIIPRGQSLGSTMFVPKKDILNHAKGRLLNQICCAMGGRVAEEMVLGEITSGASGDIKMATKIARHMVCDWGMSPLGPVAYGDNQDHVFLGKEIARNQNYSEQTALRIDTEIRSLVEVQYARAVKIITDHRAALDTIAEGLLEYETLDGKHVLEILNTGAIQSEVIRRPPSPAKDADDTPPVEKRKKAPGDEGEDLPPETQPALA